MLRTLTRRIPPLPIRIAVSAAIVVIASVAAAGTSVRRQITSHPAADRCPRWSPDAERIAAFTRAFSAGEHDDIVLLDPDGGEPVRVTRAEGHDFCPTWSPRGNALAWIRIPPEGARFVAVGGLDGRGRAMIGRGFDRVTEPDWARAGGRLVVYAAGDDGASDLYVETAP